MGREEIFIDLGGGAPKMPTFYQKTDLNSDFHCLRPATAMMDGLRTFDP